MALETWGDKPKSQVDPGTVDEEIDAKIADHEADADAHLEAGESLQSHKAAEIIDHLARSIVRDKILFDRFTIDSIFESMDAWATSGNVYIQQINSFVVQTAASLNSVAFAMLFESDNHQGQADYSLNPNFQITAFWESVSNVNSYIGPISDNFAAGFGFKSVNDTLYAVYFDDDEVEQSYSLGSISAGTNYVLRCMFDPVTNTHYWYINGTEVYSVVYDHNYSCAVFCLLYCKTTNTSLKRLWFSDLHYDVALLIV